MTNPGTKPAVLLVDDEESVTDGLRLLVRRLGYDVLVASSARRALQVLAERHVDVVVSDERMPGTSGTAFLSALALARPDVVRIVLSGGGLPVAQRAVNEASAFRFLRKPCSQADLTKALADALAHRALHLAAAAAQASASAAVPTTPPATGPSLAPGAGPPSAGSIKRTASGAIVLEGFEDFLDGTG